MTTPDAAQTPDAPPVGPIRESNRLDSLDLLRGFAILGILFVNIAFFAEPFMLAVYPEGVPEWPVVDQLAWAFKKVFCEYKFVSTFSLLFGAGFIMQWMRAEASNGGIGFIPRYLRRLLVLAIFGTLHGFLLWYGDILLAYAIAGMLLLLFRRMQPRTLILTAAGILAATILLMVSCAGLQMLAESGQFGEQQSATLAPDEPLPLGWDAIVKAQFDPSNEIWIAGERIAYTEGPFVDAQVFRTVSFLFALLFYMLGFGWHVFAMFLIGAALMKLGFFNRDHRAAQLRMGIVGLAVGLPLSCANAAVFYFGAEGFGWDEVATAALQELSSVPLCLGYVGMVSWIASTGACRTLLHPIRSVGRMALTTYLGSTALATFVMYHWGLGWFGTLGASERFVLVLCIYALLAAIAPLWLRAFRFGPLEWLWRTVTYQRSPAMRAT